MLIRAHVSANYLDNCIHIITNDSLGLVRIDIIHSEDKIEIETNRKKKLPTEL